MHCKATRIDGSPCRANPLPGREYCLYHDPEFSELLKIAKVRGGKARQGRRLGRISQPIEPIRLESAADVRAIAERAINETLNLEISASRSRTLSSLLSIALKAVEMSVLEKRLEALEGDSKP